MRTAPLKTAHVPSPLIDPPSTKRPAGRPAAPSTREMISLAGVAMCRSRIAVAFAATPRFGAADLKVTSEPSSLRPAGVETPSPRAPAAVAETTRVVAAPRSRTKVWAGAAGGTPRLAAALWKATTRPSALITGLSAVAFAPAPSARETRRVVFATRSRT